MRNSLSRIIAVASVSIPWQHSRILFALLALLLGVYNTVALIGADAVDPMNIDWLTGDAVTLYLGWAFLRQEPVWHFPLTYTTRLGFPLGIPAAHTDMLPLIGLALRPFSTFLPEPFQYLGLYSCAFMVLQAYLGFLLCHRTSGGNMAVTGIGGLFFLLSPVLTLRLSGHFAVAGHCLILAGLTGLLAAHPSASPIRRICLFWLLVMLGGSLNAYIGIMCLWIACAAILQLFLEKRCTAYMALGLTLISTALLVGAFFLVGFLTGGRVGDYNAGGYRYFSMNLLAPVNPMQFGSAFLPSLPVATPGQYEGYNYLGLGIIGLLALNLAKRPSALCRLMMRRMAPLSALGLLCLVLAVTPTVTAGSLTLMTLPIPYWLEVLLGVYRSSGRFFWPLYYLLMLVAVAMTWHNWKPSMAVALLALALSIQIIDILPLRGAVYVAGHGDLHKQLTNPVRPPSLPPDRYLNDPIWRTLGANHSALMVIPPWQCGNENTPGGMDGFAIFGTLAAAQHMMTNSYYTARNLREAIHLHCESIPQQIREGHLDLKSAYVVDAVTLRALEQADLHSHRCIQTDGFNLCVRNIGQ